ncbi:MAG: hypothetical protein ACI9R3_002150 [Verrucomicrobiales bacterium]|jgi:hypothetical protein
MGWLAILELKAGTFLLRFFEAVSLNCNEEFESKVIAHEEGAI